MFSVISLFSLINDDIDVKNGRIYIIPESFENQISIVKMPYTAIIESEKNR